MVISFVYYKLHVDIFPFKEALSVVFTGHKNRRVFNFSSLNGNLLYVAKITGYEFESNTKSVSKNLHEERNKS